MTHPTDSPLATQFVPALGLKRGKLSARQGYEAIVVHTTGGGVLRRFESQGARKGDKTPFDTAVRIYATIMDPSPHYVVGQAGEITQVVPENLAAWHVGAKDSEPYKSPQWRSAFYRWWSARWPGLRSPRELAGGKLWLPSCNFVSVGIEVVPPIESERAPWSNAARSALLALIRDIATRRSIPLTEDRVVSHSDAHPIARTTRHGAPWDPPPTQWQGLAQLSQAAPPNA